MSSTRAGHLVPCHHPGAGTRVSGSNAPCPRRTRTAGVEVRAGSFASTLGSKAPTVAQVTSPSPPLPSPGPKPLTQFEVRGWTRTAPETAVTWLELQDDWRSRARRPAIGGPGRPSAVPASWRPKRAGRLQGCKLGRFVFHPPGQGMGPSLTSGTRAGQGDEDAGGWGERWESGIPRPARPYS